MKKDKMTMTMSMKKGGSMAKKTGAQKMVAAARNSKH